MAFLGGPFAQFHGALIVEYGGVTEFVAECFHMGLSHKNTRRHNYLTNPIPFWLVHNIRLNDRVNGTTINIQLES